MLWGWRISKKPRMAAKERMAKAAAIKKKSTKVPRFFFIVFASTGALVSTIYVPLKMQCILIIVDHFTV